MDMRERWYVYLRGLTNYTRETKFWILNLRDTYHDG